MKKIAIVSLALIMVLSAVALADGIGAFSAFKNGIGARALAMGGAFVAVANDATAVCWNPAGLAQGNSATPSSLEEGLRAPSSFRLFGMSTAPFSSGGYDWGITHQFVGATTSFANLGIGLGWERSAIDGQIVLDDSGGLGGAFTWVESAIIGSLATHVMDIGMVGANVKYYMADSGDGDKATGFGFDLGLMVSLGDTFVIGVNAADLAGSTVTWDNGTTNTISGMYTAGFAVFLVNGDFILAADMDVADAGLDGVHFGMEFQIIDELALRAGVHMSDGLTESTLAVGGGVNVAGLSVDFAYLVNDNLGNTIVLSAEFSLGGLLGGGEDVEEEPAGIE